MQRRLTTQQALELIVSQANPCDSDGEDNQIRTLSCLQMRRRLHQKKRARLGSELTETSKDGTVWCEKQVGTCLHITPKEPYATAGEPMAKAIVDVMDQMVREYSVRAGTQRWPVAVFYNMIDMAALNAHVLYQACIEVQERRVDFLVELAKELGDGHVSEKKARKEKLLLLKPSTPSPGKRAKCQVNHRCTNNCATVRCAGCYKYTCGKCTRVIPWQCHVCSDSAD
nr:uncharacterized protein LOC129156801 [Nothobranchius furzeri]